MNRHPHHRDHNAPNAPRWTQERSPYASKRLEQLRARYSAKYTETKTDEPAPDPELRQRLAESLEDWIQEFANPDGTIAKTGLIPILQKAQELIGYMPEWAMADIADRVGQPYSVVYGVVTFYSAFRLAPRGRNVIRVCMGTACHVEHGADILEVLRDELGIGPGETTPDDEFTIERVACLGACGLAPVLVLNGEAYGRLTPDDVRELVAQVRDGSSDHVAD